MLNDLPIINPRKRRITDDPASPIPVVKPLSYINQSVSGVKRPFVTYCYILRSGNFDVNNGRLLFDVNNGLTVALPTGTKSIQFRVTGECWVSFLSNPGVGYIYNPIVTTPRNLDVRAQAQLQPLNSIQIDSNDRTIWDARGLIGFSAVSSNYESILNLLCFD